MMLASLSETGNQSVRSVQVVRKKTREHAN